MIEPTWRPHLPSARQHPCVDGPDRPSIPAENSFGLHATACGTEYAISAPFFMPREWPPELPAATAGMAKKPEPPKLFWLTYRHPDGCAAGVVVIPVAG
jgi:hypothetical protein